VASPVGGQLRRAGAASPMSRGAAPAGTGVPHRRPPGRAGVATAAVLLALAVAAGVLTVQRTAGMGAGLWAYPHGLAPFVTAWIAMMAAMMLPAAVPSALRVTAGSHGRPGAVTTVEWLLQVGAYLGVWAAAGLVVYEALGAVGALDPGLSMGGGRALAAAVLLAGAACLGSPSARPPAGADARRQVGSRGCAWRSRSGRPLIEFTGHGGAGDGVRRSGTARRASRGGSPPVACRGS